MCKTDSPTALTPLDSILSFLDGQEEFVFLDTNRVDASNSRSYVFSDLQDRLILKNGAPIEEFFLQAENYLKKGFYLSGWMAYELGYLLEPSLNSLQKGASEQILADLGVFQAPIIFDHLTGQFNPHFPAQKSNLPHERREIDVHPASSVQNLQPNLGEDDYLDKIRRIKSYIESGDTYQVNYTLKLLFDFTGDPSALYKTLRNNQSVSYGAYLKFGDQIIQSFSPELFFRKTGDTCTVRPMKGTSARGKTFAEDHRQADILQKDIKNRSENVMIVDLLRNDLGRICKMGQVDMVSLFDIETYQTLHQMTSTIKGNLLPNIGLMDLFKAIFPCGSVTGAPKIRTMEIINELELLPRGAYTGAIGFIAPSRDMEFNVPIRTVVLNKNKGEMGIGSGIVHESDPAGEWQECLLKGRFLTDPTPEFQLIETILWAPESGFFLVELHLQRLAQSAAYFRFPINRQSILAAMTEQASLWAGQKIDLDTNTPLTEQTAQRVRVLLHRDGHFSISATPCGMPENLGLPVQNKYRPEGHQKANLSEAITDSASPYLFHKTTKRELYDSELRRAREGGFCEVFFTNERGEVTEGAISNIVVQTGEHYFTPPVSCGLLPGIMRTHLLETSPQVKEKILTLKDLEEADHVYMANSVRGVVEVKVNINKKDQATEDS